jgi:predicted tellurium resistance membrane protein TerC
MRSGHGGSVGRVQRRCALVETLALAAGNRQERPMDWVSNPEIWIALVTLTVLELVLGIDNIIFISILAGKLPPDQQARARVVGLGLAMFTRILLLVSLAWLAHLSEPLFTVWERGISARDLILLVGGLFLLSKSTREIHEKLEGHDEVAAQGAGGPTFGAVIGQIIVLDIVFSIDSVITAVGMVDQIGVMVAAVILAVIMMMIFSGPISTFVERHPTVKMLALSFLLLIGVALIADGLHFHIPRGYIYFAMGFSVMVEMLNLRLRRPQDPPVHLRSRL